MGNEQIVAVKITTDAAGANETVKGYKQQLREATAELVNMSIKFGETSTQAKDAAKKVASLKDAIGDAKALADTFNPDKKFVALGGALQGAVGGFSALQGAMGLFGGEGKQVEAALLKVQSAMALQQGISGVAGAMDSFKLLGNEIKGNVTKAFSTLKGSIAATGIGLLVIGLGLLIANFDKVKTAVNNLIPGLGKVADFVSNIINKVTDFIGVTNEAQRASDKLIAANEKQIKKTNEFLDANADKYDAYTVRKIKANNDYRTHENEILKDSTKTEAEKQNLLKQFRDKADRDIAAADLDRQSKIDEANQKAAEKNKQHQDKITAANKAAAEKKVQAEKDAADKIKEIEANRAIQQTATDDLITQNMLNRIKDDFIKKQNEIAVNNQKEIDKEAALLDQKLISKETYDQRVKLINENTDIEQQALIDAKNLTAEEKEKKHQDELTKTADEAAKAKIEIEKKLKEARLALLDDYAGAVGNVANVIGKDTAAGKALSVAQALISTYTGISRGVALGFPAAIPAVISAAATGFGAVKNILATKVPGQGSGGSLPAGANVAAAVAPLTAQAATTTLDQQSINSIGQASSRAFVLETDVTNNQERIARLNRAARIN